MELLVANLLHPDRNVDREHLDRLIIDPDRTAQRDITRARSPRVIRMQATFDPRYERVIYMVRDPRDVVLSQYRDLRGAGEERTFEAFIGLFLAGQLGDRYLGSWGENVGSWLGARSGYPGFLLLRYEDLLADPGFWLARAANFAGWPSDAETIAQAIKRASSGMAASSGNWQSDLPEPFVARLEAAWGHVMACAGYELVTRDRRAALDPSLLGLLIADTAERHPIDSAIQTAIR